MQYEPIKEKITLIIKDNLFFRKVFYILLDIFILRQWYVKKMIKKYLPKTAEILFYDAGAGFCQYSDFVLSRYKKARVCAVDMNIKSRDTQSRIDFIQANLETYKIPTPQKADFVIAIDILEHIHDDIAVLKNFYESMNDNGILLISTPSNHDRAALFTEEHVRPGYSLNELINKIETSGFTIIESRYSYGFWGKLYWLLIMKNGVRLASSSKFMQIILPFYLLFVFIPSIIFMSLDFFTKNKSGTGIILVAKKMVDKKG